MTNTNTIFLADSIGDAYLKSPFSDLIGLQVQETNIAYTFRVDFQDLSAGANVNILLDFDGDRAKHATFSDRQTHNPNQLTEASIWSQVAILGIVETLYLQGSQANYLTSRVSGDSLYIYLPKSILPIEANNLEVAVSANLDFASEGYDRLANEGYLNLTTGQIHIDNEGLNLSPLSWLNDPAYDQPPPVDLKGITMNLVGEHLVIRQYFHHNIDPYSISDVINGYISLDLDGDILTGFDNVDEVFATFGIDAEISYFQYPWALGGGFDANLTYLPYPEAEPVTVMLGSPTSDSSYRIGTNWVEISVPLGLLPPITENAVILSDALAPLGGFDRAPNDSGIKLKDGTVAPFLQWGSPSYQISDPRDDSFAFGYDNDDLTLVKASRYQDGILMQINYTDLRTEGGGMSVIDFDTNQDYKADIGLAFAWNPYAIGESDDFLFTAILIDQVTGEIIQSANPLVSLDFGANCAYVNIPNRALGTSATIQAQVKTTDPDYGLLYDQTGILTIPSQGTANIVNDVSNSDSLSSGSPSVQPQENDDFFDGLFDGLDWLFGSGNSDGQSSDAPFQSLTDSSLIYSSSSLDSLLTNINNFFAMS